ncbi:hypothetical protein GPJ56_002780 [Histomonas meleagridis]|uniref:uncharacterized protein n=1 Tax=Histomonas meleagridis TaxID=135588 RepID=UPI003559E98A|nr:hypothetical protein GPJ56_002780 [Histomonas meleagridis]KAH0800087.1 hypothetical protein GO595_007199 [Histomonas meleagridis]
MNKEEAAKLFTDRLDTYYEANLVNVDTLCWFADDFERFKQAFVNEIVNRILNPHYIKVLKGTETREIIQPPLPLYYLIDAISKDCHQGYRMLFEEKLLKLFQSSLRSKDAFLIGKLSSLVDVWDEKNMFNEKIISSIRELFQGKLESVAPAPLMETPVVYEPQIEPPIPMQPPPPQFMQPPIIIQPSLSDEEQRLCRSWMRTSVDWETPSPQFMLVTSIDEDEPIQNKEEPIQYVPITPQNQSATCVSCGGTFENGKGLNGEESFIGVVYIPGKGYAHQKCLQYLREDKEIFHW